MQLLIHRQRLVFVLVALILILCLALLLSYGASGGFRLGGSGGTDPNGVTNGSMINPDGLAAGVTIDGNGSN